MCVITATIMTGVKAADLENEAARSSALIQYQQADAERSRAEQETEAAQTEAFDAARKARMHIGTGKAQMAANGVVLDDARDGSLPTMYEADAQAELAYDQMKIMHNAQLRAWGYRENARVLDMQAHDTARLGRAKASIGYVSSALSGLNAGINTYGALFKLFS